MGWLRDTFPALRLRDNADPQPMAGFPTGGISGVLPYAPSTSTVVGLPAVARCLDVLANGVSQLPWHERRGNLDLPLSRLTRRPYSQQTRREWVQWIVRCLALWDTAYLLKLGPFDTEGMPSGLWPIPPTIITPITSDMYAFIPPNEYRVGREVISADMIVVLRRGPLPGVADYLNGVLRTARAQFAEYMAAANYASRYWQAGGPATVTLTTDANLSDTQAAQLGNRWAQRRSQGPDHPAILSSGLKAGPFGADPLTESAVEARRDMVADIARFFGIPSSLANAPSVDSETYKNVEEQNLDLLRYTLANYIGAIQDAITDLLPGGREMVMETSVLTSASMLPRFQAYQLATGSVPWMSPAEVREDEHMPPLEVLSAVDESQRPLTPLSNTAAPAILQATGRQT